MTTKYIKNFRRDYPDGVQRNGLIFDQGIQGSYDSGDYYIKHTNPNSKSST